ncbi:MAG: NTP/NDP exchange transporter [Francisellaceae bacterium]|jgi:ATP:ADP antiporter, AAA family|nr:NTP/NDP exchange transporter [Francisellaceae bacterium]MBT6539103.1 NTP/NDP exchange transporter [Francisellaceae bacterium]
MADNSVTTDKPFGKWRSFFWPIYSYELKRLFPMFVLFFLISFVYNLLRCMKIALMVTAAGSGAEAVPFLKIGAVLPGAILLTYLFTKLSSKFSRETVFYTIIVGFLSYFAIFALILFPNRESLELNSFYNYMLSMGVDSKGLKGLVAAVRHYNLTIFYVMCELWSSVVLSMLFWGFANEITKVNEAKRFYAIFALGANCSGIFTGVFVTWLGSVTLPDVFNYTGGIKWVFYQLMAVLFLGLCIVGIFYWLNKSILHMSNMKTITIPKKKSDMSLKECFRYMFSSKYLSYIVILVVAYNVVYNLADVMWTDKVKSIYQSSEAVNAYMNRITQITGFISAIFAFIISGNVIRRYGWTVAALVAPIIWLLTSLGFFSGLLFESTIPEFLASIDASEIFYTMFANPANLVLLLGSIQICLGRGCKYTVFDETKEIAFIPLSQENQRKAKAVVDGIASRFGKSGGSVIYIILFTFLGSVSETVPYVSAIIFIAIGLWVFAVIGLGRMVTKTIDKEEADKESHSSSHDNNISNEKNTSAPIIINAVPGGELPA